jgi:L-aspartate oxidase
VGTPEPPIRPVLERAVLQRAMTHFASVVRSGTGLTGLIDELDAAAPRVLRSRNDFEDAALTAVAAAVAAAALARTETRGCHHRSDFPATDPAQACSVTRSSLAPAPAGC